MMRAPFEVHGAPPVPVVATAIHAGHDLRPEVRSVMALDEATRRREEDPFTEVVARGVDAHVVVHRSRFEVDLNRSRDEAVYLRPEDSWGLEVWAGALPLGVAERSREIHDAFYRSMARLLDPLAAHGPFVVLDVHSYNHRRSGPDAAPAPLAGNPDVNVGTGSLDRRRFGPVVDRFLAAVDGAEGGAGRLDVRENVRFEGAHLARWVHERYPGTGCVLALELKKTFMDEWTDEVDHAHLARLRGAIVAAIPSVLAGLDEVADRGVTTS
jgi:N-formylglutamate deformylase